MESKEFQVSTYVTGIRNNVTYEDMSRYHLTSEQVREIAIARANARKKADEEVVTIHEDTKGKLEVVKLETEKPEKIVLSDDFTKIQLYNHREMMKFKKNPQIFDAGGIIQPASPEGKGARELFQKFYESNIYSHESVLLCKDLQKFLGFSGDDVDGAFGPKTQKKLLEIFAKLAPPTPPAVPNTGLDVLTFVNKVTTIGIPALGSRVSIDADKIYYKVDGGGLDGYIRIPKENISTGTSVEYSNITIGDKTYMKIILTPKIEDGELKVFATGTEAVTTTAPVEDKPSHLPSTPGTQI